MDNHRLALWCWLRHLGSEDKVEFVHMDEHYDCLMSHHNSWVAALPRDISALSLSEYLEYPWQGVNEICPLFRFDNYLSLFMARHGAQIKQVYISTHHDGDRPSFAFLEFSILECMGYLNARCSNTSSTKFFLNIDIDYFTETGFDEPIMIVSQDFLRAIGKIIGKGLRNGAIGCLTVALSPEFTGTWELAEMIVKELLKAAEVPFELPRD
ncbi:MAG: UPF0489 family protein [Candidatus Electrothrix sp. Rat3]|nr:UPF0489 family protein [Candidatus Electrothrix rattekaaiensis]